MENHQHGGRRAQSLYCAISLAERRNKAIAPYEPNPTMTIEDNSPVSISRVN
jgi:hypothetical protein